MKVINVSGLIGTQDYLVPITRTSLEALEITPSWRKINHNNSIIRDTPVAGLIPVSVSINGVNASYAYKKIKVSTALTVEERQVLSPADYALFEEGTYYQNINTTEIFYVVAKNEDYSVIFNRGILGTPVNAIATTDNINVMNTLRFDSGSGSETLGKFTLTKGTAPMVNGDTITITIGMYSKMYVIGTDIPAGEDINKQGENIADALAQDFTDWGFVASSGNITATQKTGYGKPFAVTIGCAVHTPANAITHSTAGDTLGVAKTYDTGSGFVIYKEMPRNVALGQPVYPSYNYHVDGK